MRRNERIRLKLFENLKNTAFFPLTAGLTKQSRRKAMPFAGLSGT
jgi:hypothetical protein